jgi:hypothetical protein
MASVKVKRLTRSIPEVPFVHYRGAFVRRSLGEAPKLKRPFHEQNSRGRLTAQKEFSGQAKTPTPTAMDCSVWLTVGLSATTVEQILPRCSSEPGQENPSAKPFPLLLLLATLPRLVSNRKSSGQRMRLVDLTRGWGGVQVEEKAGKLLKTAGSFENGCGRSGSEWIG